MVTGHSRSCVGGYKDSGMCYVSCVELCSDREE